MKKLHKWPSLIIAIFILLWAVSGIVLNHRHTFSSFDVGRMILPAEHQYKDWNNAAIRSSIRLDSARTLFYGNVGVWQYDGNKNSWTDQRTGLPPGADHHKVNCLIQYDKDLYCGTRFGLYKFSGNNWHAIDIPHKDKHVVDLAVIHDSLFILTRSHMWKYATGNETSFMHVPILPPLGYDNKVGLFKTLWVIHSGEIYGIAGKLLVDFVALVFVFLTISGLIYFFFPRLIRKRKKKDRPVKALVFWIRYAIKWHNRVGIWLAAVLIITTITGMFLRPPLLIAIASGRVGKIPYSVLDDGNPWHDKLRRMLYDREKESVFLATSEGIFLVDDGFSVQPVKPDIQPPVSVMGYNVFRQHDHGGILVGSFSGLYRWYPERNLVIDHIAGSPYIPGPGPAMPVSENMISGYHRTADLEYIFDYNQGVLSLGHSIRFPDMPEPIRRSRMPLWNVALELHTARLFKPFLGDFYILFIPLFGLSALLILASGTILWIRKFRKRKK